MGNRRKSNRRDINPSPWKVIQKTYSEAAKNFRESKYECIQKICILEKELRDNESCLKKFCSDHFWKDKKGPSPDQPEKLLGYMFKYMCGDSPDASKTASLYTRAARNIMKGKLPRENIAAEIKKRGGIRTLASPKAERSDGKELNHCVDRIAKPFSSSAVAAKASTSSKVISRNNSEVLFVHTDGFLDDILEDLKSGNIRMEVSLRESEPDGFKRVEFIDYCLV